MTDNEIIKALECCKNDDCDNCPNTFGNCYANLAGYALDLIKRQEKEIEEKFEIVGQQGKYIKGLKEENERIKIKIYKMAIDKVLAEKAKAEAIKKICKYNSDY